LLIRKRQFIKPENERNRIMGLFNNLMSKIFGHAAPATTASASQAAGAAPAAGGTAQTPAAAGSSAPAPAAAPAAPVVDVAAVLNDLAKKNPEKLDWRKSIVDLMKLVGMDSSLTARRQLATELHFTGDMNDSASMNVWLHKQVLIKLAENGGKVPPELLS
jgi:3-oxoacyl-ACP reductase-like protein